MTLRPALQAIVDRLLVDSDATKSIAIDAVGDALGVMRVDPTEIDAMLTALEGAGRTIAVPTGATGIASLKVVLPASRTLTKELGRKPTIDEIALKIGLSVADVRRALLLAQVMGRGSRG